MAMILKSLFGSPLPQGARAPEFELPDQHGKTHRLSDYLGRWVVLYFYPKDHTFGCTREACSFRDELAKFPPNVTVLGVSTDTVNSHESFAEAHQLNFPILADAEKKTSQDYGVLTRLGFANRVTFLIDPQGFIADRMDWANWWKYGKSVAERLSKLRR
jgi:peroxiredoxin Q/BCP